MAVDGKRNAKEARLDTKTNQDITTRLEREDVYATRATVCEVDATLSSFDAALR